MKEIRLKKNGKTPLVAGAFNGEDYKLIQSWYQEGGNVGTLTGSASGIAVIDIDNHNGVDGLGNLKNFLDTYDIELPKTMVVKTPSGGYHYYFKLDEKYNDTQFIQNHKLLEGVDFQTHGRYVVAPGSKLPTYERIVNTTDKPPHNAINITEVIEGTEVLPITYYSYDAPTGKYKYYEVVRDVELAELPEKWLEMFTDKTIAKKNKKRERKWTANLLGDIIAGCPQGGRNIWLSQQIGKLFATGLDHEEVKVWAQYVNQIGCNPPLDNDEVMQTYESLRKREIRRMGEE